MEGDVIYPPQFTSNRIVGGSEASEGLARYQISMQTSKGRHFCGGAIIGTQWIITASHCVDRQKPGKIKILTGSQELKNDTGRYYFADRIIKHCSYNKPAYANDIALIHLNDTIEFNDHTQPVELNTEPLNEGDELMLTGWGTLSLGGEVPKKLQALNVTYVPFDECRIAHNGSAWIDIGHLCTLNEKGKGACHGDSGGPLVFNNKLVALVNWGRPCAKGYPDANAKISYYYDFIRTTMHGCTSYVYNDLLSNTDDSSSGLSSGWWQIPIIRQKESPHDEFSNSNAMINDRILIVNNLKFHRWLHYAVKKHERESPPQLYHPFAEQLGLCFHILNCDEPNVPQMDNAKGPPFNLKSTPKLEICTVNEKRYLIAHMFTVTSRYSLPKQLQYEI
uniref:trypsin n=1 Tax=Glossina brevipalpis TaxID=37001 RepID=A0A1A9X401_9MUSC